MASHHDLPHGLGEVIPFRRQPFGGPAHRSEGLIGEAGGLWMDAIHDIDELTTDKPTTLGSRYLTIMVTAGQYSTAGQVVSAHGEKGEG